MSLQYRSALLRRSIYCTLSLRRFLRIKNISLSYPPHPRFTLTSCTRRTVISLPGSTAPGSLCLKVNQTPLGSLSSLSSLNARRWTRSSPASGRMIWASTDRPAC